MESLKLGKYRHYKGGEYEVIALALREGSLEPMAVYRSLAADKKIWTRPISEFVEIIERPDLSYKGPRFQYVGE